LFNYIAYLYHAIYSAVYLLVLLIKEYAYLLNSILITCIYAWDRCLLHDLQWQFNEECY